MFGREEHRGLGVRGLRAHLETGRFQRFGDHLAHVRVVVGDQDGDCHGMTTSIIVPTSGAKQHKAAAECFGALAHARQAESRKPSRTAEPDAVVGDDENDRVGDMQADGHPRGLAVATAVVDRFTDDPQQRLDVVRRQVEIGRNVERQHKLVSVRGVASDRGELFARVSRADQRRDDEARFVERMLGRVGEPVRIAGVDVVLELGRDGRDVREFLGNAVVQVVGEPPAFFHVRGSAPVAADLARGADQEQEHTGEAQPVTDVDPVREDRREREVVEARERKEHAARREPGHEIAVFRAGGG